MNYYIADCHFSHKNILHFDQRPFENVEQMEETAILKSNLKVLAFVHPFVNHFSTPHKAKILYG